MLQTDKIVEQIQVEIRWRIILLKILPLLVMEKYFKTNHTKH